MENQPRKAALSKTLSIVLALAILGAIAALIHNIAVPASGDGFTEFYILGPGGSATDYPSQLEVGEEAIVIIGIGNQEQDAVSYRVEIKIDGAATGELGPIALKHGERFEQVAAFTPDKPGEQQRVEFLLYKEGQTGVYESLHLWVDVGRKD